MFPFQRWMVAKSKQSKRVAARPRSCRLAVEPLEARWLPSAFTFSTGSPDGKMATASRPASLGKIEIESADDFILSSETDISQATFTGLLPAGFSASDITGVRVEIYAVFPNSSDPTRTPRVPTRTNSPSDVEVADRDTAAGDLSFGFAVLNGTFSAANSVLNGIHAAPHQTTGGEGPRTGAEVQFQVTFTPGFDLTAGHYFFVPQVRLRHGNFFWLSTPPHQFSGDLQEWIRNGALQPDWLRVGTDIVGGSPAPTVDAAFSLSGV